jgi:hypothetical protein
MRGLPSRKVVSLAAVALLLAALFPLAGGPAASSPTPLSLSSTLEAPRWAVGFYWTYHYEGATNQSFSGFQATYLNDTYTSEVIGELSTTDGPAWLALNTHQGTMSGTAPGGFPATAAYDSTTYSGFLKSNLALLNFTQDLNIQVDLPTPFPSINASAHNDTTAAPPLAQVSFGTAADGTLWHVYGNLSSSGYYTIGTSPPIPVTSYTVLDYNLSVNGTANFTVPAGTFEAYNISGNGTVDQNGTLYNFSEAFAWAPRVMNKVVDEFGYELIAFFVNRPPGLTDGLPLLNVTAGGPPTSYDLSTAFEDPEGDSFSLSCQVPANFTCSVDGGGLLNVSANPGVNETVTLTITADDGLPGGNATFDITVLASGNGNPNLPPTLTGGPALTTPEDVAYAFNIADHFTDSDGGIVGFIAQGSAQVSVENVATGGFDAVPAANFNGATSFSVFVFDGHGNGLNVTFALSVTPVNDAPLIRPLTPLRLFFHETANMTASVEASDPDGEIPTVSWWLDGTMLGQGAVLDVAAALVGPGNHSLRANATDGALAESHVTFNLTVFAGPRIVSTDPPAGDLRLASGSSRMFRIAVDDPDTPELNFTWQRNGTQVGAGPLVDSFTFSFAQAGQFHLRAAAFDNGSLVEALWNVTVIEAPAGLVSIVSPANLSRYAVNSTVVLAAFVDSELSNVTYAWRLNGTLVSNASGHTIGPLAPGMYRIGLSVQAIYAATVNYSAELAVEITVDPPVGGNNSTNTTPPPPPPGEEPASNLGLILGLLFLGVAAAVTYRLFRKRRPPPPDVAPPAP